MGNKRSIVVTAYGHNKTIDTIVVSSFEGSENSYNDNQDFDAKTYCGAINALELKGDSWVFAKILSENSQYPLDVFLPLKFSDVIIKLDNRAIQKILRELDSQELTRALKGETEEVKEKIFANMSKRASKMLKEDIELMGLIEIMDIKESQDKILSVIRYLDQCGEILLYPKGETVK